MSIAYVSIMALTGFGTQPMFLFNLQCNVMKLVNACAYSLIHTFSCQRLQFKVFCVNQTSFEWIIYYFLNTSLFYIYICFMIHWMLKEKYTSWLFSSVFIVYRIKLSFIWICHLLKPQDTAYGIMLDEGQQWNHFKEIHKHIYWVWMDNKKTFRIKSEEKKGGELFPKRFGNEKWQL